MDVDFWTWVSRVCGRVAPALWGRWHDKSSLRSSSHASPHARPRGACGCGSSRAGCSCRAQGVGLGICCSAADVPREPAERQTEESTESKVPIESEAGVVGVCAAQGKGKRKNASMGFETELPLQVSRSCPRYVQTWDPPTYHAPKCCGLHFRRGWQVVCRRSMSRAASRCYSYRRYAWAARAALRTRIREETPWKSVLFEISKNKTHFGEQ